MNSFRLYHSNTFLVAGVSRALWGNVEQVKIKIKIKKKDLHVTS